MRINIKADFGRTIADVRRYKAEAIQKVNNAVNKSALNIQSDAKKRAAVDTGDFRASIVIEPSNSADIALKVGSKKMVGKYNLGWLLEYGTGKFNTKGGGRSGGWYFPASAVKSDTFHFKTITAKDGTKLYYTEGMRAQPWLTPAAEAERPKFYAAVRRALQ
ncbi:tail-component protein [Bacillus phage Silence]|nr:tail-component protein [Bacillus phage Silence]